MPIFFRPALFAFLLLLLLTGCAEEESNAPLSAVVEPAKTVIATPTAPPSATVSAPILPPPTPTSRPDESTAAAAAAADPVPAGDSGSGVFLETFDGEPAAPAPWRPINWDIVIHSRDPHTWRELQPMEAQHGPHCEGPEMTHTISAYEEAVFQCRNHMMTAIYAGGYAAIYLAPDHLVDLSGDARVAVDVSTFRSAGRDWWDLWITPYEDYLHAPLEPWLPDLNGLPRRAIHVRMPDHPSSFYVEIIDDFEVVQIFEEQRYVDISQLLTPDKARRDTYLLEISDGRIRFGLPAYDFWWVDGQLDRPLGWEQGVVQLGHHSYNPEKSCNFDGTCGPNTWHWDNLTFEPAVPFTIIRAEERYADKDNPTLNFSRPAPESAEFRFLGSGQSIEVSWDGGQSWHAPALQPQKEVREDHFRSFTLPVPAGTTTLTFRGTALWNGVLPWFVNSPALWAPAADSE